MFENFGILYYGTFKIVKNGLSIYRLIENSMFIIVFIQKHSDRK